MIQRITKAGGLPNPTVPDDWYPNNVCSRCGILANHMTCAKKFGAAPLKPAFTVSTYHKGICDVCSDHTNVTEPRDFFYPDVRAFKFVRRYILQGGAL